MSLFGVGHRYCKPFSKRFSSRASFSVLRKSIGHKFNHSRLFTNRLRRRYGSTVRN